MSLSIATFVAASLLVPTLAGVTPWQRRTAGAMRSPGAYIPSVHRPLGALPLRRTSEVKAKAFGDATGWVGRPIVAPRPDGATSHGRRPTSIAAKRKQSKIIENCPGHVEKYGYGDRKCNHEEQELICTQLLDKDGNPLTWNVPWGKQIGEMGPDRTREMVSKNFWQLMYTDNPTGMGRSWDHVMRQNGGDSWCLGLYHAAKLVEYAGCDAVTFRCNAIEVPFVQFTYSGGVKKRYFMMKRFKECFKKQCVDDESTATAAVPNAGEIFAGPAEEEFPFNIVPPAKEEPPADESADAAADESTDAEAAPEATPENLSGDSPDESSENAVVIRPVGVAAAGGAVAAVVASAVALRHRKTSLSVEPMLG